MSLINFSRKEITFKLVYYGPALCGKTTNVEQIHKAIPPENSGKLTMLSTQQDRTLYFDFLPLRSQIIKGYVSKFQVYTVPGQVIYNETRKLVLRGVDGLIFVADSQWSKMQENVESFANLEANLREQKVSLDAIPYILQYNKRDLNDVAPVHYLDYMLNQRAKGVPSMEAVATRGDGVLEALNLISKRILTKFIQANNMETMDIPNEVSVPSEGR
ncbi:MAG: gliding-motility protein MglA [Spartobacteria bacterium]|nr:gliding-motility protein MglA [Spartobacteria bacterium]